MWRRPPPRKCSEKGNAASTPACCNCKLAEGKKPHPSNYRGCSHAKEKARRKRSQIQKKTTSGMVFSSNYTTPGLSFAAAVRKTAEKTQQPPSRQPAVAGRSTREQLEPSGPSKQQGTGQAVQASSANGSHLNNMFRVVTVVQQIRTEFSDAVSEEDKILAITTIVLKLMKQNGQ
jgi:hypothetical protein